MSYPIRVKVLKQIDDFGDVEDFNLLGELANVHLDEIYKLSPLTVLLHEVKIGLVLEGIFEFDDTIVLEK